MYARSSLASSTTSVVLNGEAALMARPNSTNISDGSSDDRRLVIQTNGLDFEFAADSRIFSAARRP